MELHDAGVSQSDVELEAARAFFRRVGTGWRAWSYDKRSLMTKQQAKANWEKRRAKYGQSGSKPRSYHQWRVDHNMPPIGEDGRPVSEKLTKPTG